MIIKLLEPSRYAELLQFAEFKGLTPDPATTIVVIREDEAGKIIAFWLAQAVIHIEPVLITPAASDGGFTAMAMLKLLLSELVARGQMSFFAFADSENVIDYLMRLGLQPLPFAVFHGVAPQLVKD